MTTSDVYLLVVNLYVLFWIATNNFGFLILGVIAIVGYALMSWLEAKQKDIKSRLERMRNIILIKQIIQEFKK